MTTKERAADRGRRQGDVLRLELGRELRDGRIAANLSQHQVGRAVGLSASQLSRIERGLAPAVPLAQQACIAAVLGLRLSARLYPAGLPLRDSAQLALLEKFRKAIHRDLGWRTEVALALEGDLRAWDAAIVGGGWIVHIDAETRIRDAQALARRTALKRRDTRTDRVVLLISDTRANRAALRAVGPSLVADPLPGRTILEALVAGRDPGGSGVLIL
jgi:transcriptional regulator with XRE-family HTH domain